MPIVQEITQTPIDEERKSRLIRDVVEKKYVRAVETDLFASKNMWKFALQFVNGQFCGKEAEILEHLGGQNE